ncbi:MAG: C2H2-type zinc finger protein [Candidatus Thiodiazotropha taylori]|nr:C2H2-type zinc finger protein [Candidatus Thiodiazotropha taylori]MCW4310467.1 C2H2-type zinc finger protein [Candidatus Thiodiazotropha endolucinida]
MEKPFTCSTCHKKLSTIGNLRRHNEAFHSSNRVKFQCWHCPNTYARQESARKHAYIKHGDTERKTVKTTTGNPRWKPEIFKPGPWNPPPEARPKSGTVYKIQIPPASEQSHINNIKQQRRISRVNPYIPLTVDEALVTTSNDECTLARLNRLQVMKDLEISPSSSTSTITQDELRPEEEALDITIPTIYGIYHTSKN